MKLKTRCVLAFVGSLGALVAAMPAWAEPSAPSTLAMLNAMVRNGVITREQADKILKEAAAEDAERAARTPAAAMPEASPPQGTKRVQYVPEIVKDQIRDEVKQEVMAKAQAEGWAAPGETPEWTRRIKITGDIRGRYDGTFFPEGNAYGQADQVNFNSINAGSPLNIGAGSTDLAPTQNVDQDRDRTRLRARLGVEAKIGEEVAAGLRLATGSGSDPVSTNQTMGGSGGNFSKYQIWLDRAFITYAPKMPEKWGLTATVGRFDNPFFSTDLIWDGDLGFDGVAATGRYEAAKGVTPWLTLGAFPVYNTDFNFSSKQDLKYASQDKWLYGAQAGADWRASKNTNVKFGAAYYHFDGIEGRRSSPCDAWDNSVSCDTDATRTPFSQKGNSMMALRTWRANPSNAADQTEYQYFGLATGFRELAFTGRVDYDGLKPLFPGQALRVSFDGEFVKNLGFNRTRLERMSLNNRSGTDNRYDGGDIGYLARVTFGTPKLAGRWDWKTSLAYKYVETDAVVDGFTDSDFGLGGTNLKGFILGGDLVLMPNVWTSLRWMSADNIAGSPFSVDSVLLDINAKF